MLPKLGHGEYVSVRQRGPYLEMQDERNGDVIRLIPYQPNHGVMVEMWRDDRVAWRTHCDITSFSAMGFNAQEATR